MSIIKFSKLIQKARFFKILVIIIVVLVSLIFIFSYFFQKGGKKSKATSESITIIFDPSSLSGAATADLPPLKIMGRPTIDMRLRGYELNLTFDKNHLEVKDIIYPSSCPLVSGYSSTVNQANNLGLIKIACASNSVEGFLLSSSTQTELAKVIFKSKQSNSSNISINQNKVGFSMITNEGLKEIPSSLSNSLIVYVRTGNFSPIATNTQPPNATTQPGSISLNLKLKFQGIMKMPANENQKTMKVKIKVGGGSLSSPVSVDVNFTLTENRNLSSDALIWEGMVNLPPQVNPDQNYYLLVKGPKHIQKKICVSNPQETTAGSYRCQGNQGITLSAGENNLDFSKIYLLAGDLPVNGVQDGVVDSLDTSYIRNNLGKTDSNVVAIADLNLDGKIDAQDWAMVIYALSIKADEE